MKESKKPTPEQYGWISQNSFDDDESGWAIEGGEEKYYEALSQWNDEKVKELFDENGMRRKERGFYFDKNGDLMDWLPISNNYMKYPANSDVVKMHYAEVYADETHGNYTAQTLFFMAF